MGPDTDLEGHAGHMELWIYTIPDRSDTQLADAHEHGRFQIYTISDGNDTAYPDELMLYSTSSDLSSYSKISSVTSCQPSMLGNSLYTMAEQK